MPWIPQLFFKAQVCIAYEKHRLQQTFLKEKTWNGGSVLGALQGCYPYPQRPGFCSSLPSHPYTASAEEGPGIPTHLERRQRPHHGRSTAPETKTNTNKFHTVKFWCHPRLELCVIQEDQSSVLSKVIRVLCYPRWYEFCVSYESDS